MESSFVCCKPSSLNAHSTEGTDSHFPIWFPAPRATPVFHLGQFFRGFIHKKFHGILITHPISPSNSIHAVIIKRVVFFYDCRRTALGCNRMAPHWIDFTYHCHTKIWIGFRDGNCGTETRATTANQ